ncbi:MAG: outer membrane protein assembly factor BamD [Candidatus Krumholzibacteriia bacterium]
MTASSHFRSVMAAAGAASVVAVTALALGGCAGTARLPSASYERAVQDHERGHDREAVATIEQFLRRSPGDSLAASAQRLKVLALMKLKEYPLAAVEVQILRQEYPTSGYVGESWFLEGVALFKQVGRTERDIAPALEARSRFKRFLADWPDAPQAAEARDYLVRISDLEMAKKLGEAEVYVQLGQPAAAGVVLDTVLAQDTEGRLRPRLLLRRAELALQAKQPAAATAAWQRLVTDFPDSPEAAAARRALARQQREGS